MDEFGQGSESFADEGLDIMKEGSQQVAHQAGRMARNGISKATRGIRKGIKSAVKKAGKAAAEAIKQFAAKLIAALGPIGIVVIAFLLVFTIIFVYVYEERGSAQRNVLDPDMENPSYTDTETGIVTAIAQTEPQAVVDAYYKFMSTSSYVKTYGDKMWEFQEPEQTEDFAGLRDYNKLEENFYLSDDFIRQMDELFHENEFFYPEQLIKPVYGQKMILKDETGADKKDKDGNVKKVYTSRLPYDTPDGEPDGTRKGGKMLDDEIVKDFGDMLSDNNGPLTAPGANEEGQQLIAMSQVPTEQQVSDDEGVTRTRYTLQDRNVVMNDDSLQKEPGLPVLTHAGRWIYWTLNFPAESDGPGRRHLVPTADPGRGPSLSKCAGQHKNYGYDHHEQQQPGLWSHFF